MSYPRPAHRENSSGHVAVAWIFAVLSAFYFLPWAIAATRQKENTLTIFLLNLFLGWTGVGWILALVMSVVSDRAPMATQQQYYATTAPPAQPAPIPYEQSEFLPLPEANRLTQPSTFSYADQFTTPTANPLEAEVLPRADDNPDTAADRR